MSSEHTRQILAQLETVCLPNLFVYQKCLVKYNAWNIVVSKMIYGLVWHFRGVLPLKVSVYLLCVAIIYTYDGGLLFRAMKWMTILSILSLGRLNIKNLSPLLEVDCDVLLF